RVKREPRSSAGAASPAAEAGGDAITPKPRTVAIAADAAAPRRSGLLEVGMGVPSSVRMNARRQASGAQRSYPGRVNARERAVERDPGTAGGHARGAGETSAGPTRRGSLLTAERLPAPADEGQHPARGGERQGDDEDPAGGEAGDREDAARGRVPG